MNHFEEDSIIVEVRENRAELLTEFSGDTKKFTEYLISQKPIMEACGWRYETAAELEARKAFHKQEQTAELNKIEMLITQSMPDT